MHETKLSWQQENNVQHSTIFLEGELTRGYLLPLWKQVDAIFSGNQQPLLIWDLKNIIRIDSAGFAMLCTFLSKIHVHQKLAFAPQQLHVLADLFELKDWLSEFYLK